MIKKVRVHQMIYFLLATGIKKKIGAGPCRIIFSFLCTEKMVPITNYIANCVRGQINNSFHAICVKNQSREIIDIDLRTKTFVFKKVNYCQYPGTYLVYNPASHRLESHHRFSVSKNLNILVYEIIAPCASRFIEKFTPGSMIPYFSLNLQQYALTL